jgi:predicted sulfurtransferase
MNRIVHTVLQWYHCIIFICTSSDVLAALWRCTRLHVRVREQILADGLTGPDMETINWKQAGKEMPPLEWHRVLTAQKQKQSTPLTSNGTSGAATAKESNNSRDDVVVLDCRNSYESDVGVFEGAVPLNTTFFRETWPVLEQLLKDTPKDTPVLTYCTGGIRCVKVNAYLQQKMGFTNTHRLAGGIIAYNRELSKHAQELQNGSNDRTNTADVADRLDATSRFVGVNYVFDERIGARVTEGVLTMCEQCAAACDTFTNCPNSPCNVRLSGEPIVVDCSGLTACFVV